MSELTDRLQELLANPSGIVKPSVVSVPDPAYRDFKISVIIPACNEEDLVPTGLSVLASEVHFPDKIEVVVVSNGQPSQPTGLPNDQRVIISHTQKQLGVGGARNVGCSIATGEVLVIIDGHMRFDKGAIRKLAQVALDKGTWVCGGVHIRRPDGNRSNHKITAAHMNYHHNRYVGYKYMNVQDDVGEVPLITGAFFAVPRSTFDVWGEWDNTAGKWGYSEEGQSIKNWFLGRKMWCCPGAVADHFYRGSNPYPISGDDRWLNVCQTHMIYFGKETFEKYWLPIINANCKRSAKIKEIMDDPANQAKHLQFQADKKHTDEEFFKDILRVQTSMTTTCEVVDVPRFSVIIPACNEGDELLRTIDSVLASATSEPEVIIVDDKSDDGSIDKLMKHKKDKLHHRYKPFLSIYRNPKRMGVDASRNFGVAKATGKYVIFTDAHTRWPNRCGEQLTQYSINTGGLICAAFQNFTESEDKPGSITYGAYFVNRKDRAVGNAYIKAKPDIELQPINAIIGSCYCMPKKLFNELGGWYEVPNALWGYSEQALAWKVYFWQVGRMYCSRDVVIKHRLRANHRFPYQISNQENVNPQAHFVHRVCFEEKTYNEMWRPVLEPFFGPPAAGFFELPYVKKCIDEFALRRKKTDAEFFAEVMPDSAVK